MTTEDQEDQHFKSLCWILVFMMLYYFTQGQEYKCEVEFTGKCISKVTWTIPEKYAHRKTPFTVSYTSSEGKSENAVLLHYVGRYFCEAAGGHVCDDGGNSTSIIRNSATICVTDRLYILAADGENDVYCIPTQNETESTGSHPDTRKQNDTSCRNDNLQSGQEGNSVTVGVSSTFGIVLLAGLAILAVFLWRRRHQGKTEQKNKRDIERGDPVDEKQEFLKQETGKEISGE